MTSNHFVIGATEADQRLDRARDVHHGPDDGVGGPGRPGSSRQVPGRGEGQDKGHGDGEGGSHEGQEDRLDEEDETLMQHGR